MKKMIDLIKNYVGDVNRSFKERTFVVLTFTAEFIVTLSLIRNLLIRSGFIPCFTLFIVILITPVITYVCVRGNRVETATRIISLSIILVVMPVIFFYRGGSNGPGVIWFIFTYLYIGLVLSGRWRVFSVILHTLSIFVIFSIGYYRPDLIYTQSDVMMYFDLATSVVEVGFVCYIMTRFQSLLFEKENERAKEEAKKFEDLNKSQNRFFSNMSHEIRTPINSILGLNEIILRQEDASDEIIKDARNIQGAGNMLLSLVNDILDISKIEAGKMDIVSVNYGLAGLVSEIVNMIWLRSSQKKLALEVYVDPSIPGELFGDEVKIKQILINLLNNAVKYTQEGSVTLRIEKEEMSGDDVHILFSVTDTGMGIRQDAIPYLFDAFQRMDEEKNRKIEGTGLGLAIVKQLVDLMDGTITVNSIYTAGSTFVVSLWQKISDPTPVGEISIGNLGNSRRSKKYEAGFTAHDAYVLIVDDNEMNLEVEKKLLDGTGLIVDTATSGEAALAKTVINRYDVILMDHLMPGMDGIECLERIRTQVGGLNTGSPVVVLTANAGAEERALYNSSGFDGYLVKPVSGAALEDMLLSHIRESKIVKKTDAGMSVREMKTARGYSHKLPVLITTNSMCDLPSYVYRNYPIDAIPVTIRIDDKIYYDGYEAGPDEILRYISDGSECVTEPPTVEEFKKFFSEGLKRAHQIVHIAYSADISKEFENADDASRSFGNVFVVDSENATSSVGMLVLIAYKMTRQGLPVDKIIEVLDLAKKNTSCSFMLASSEMMMRRGIISKGLHSTLSSLNLHPLIYVKDDKFKFSRVFMGDLKRSYEKYVDHVLSKKLNPDPDLVFIEHIGVSEEMIEYIKSLVLAKYPFKHVILQKVSAATALNIGSGSIGLMFFKKGEMPCSIGMLLPDETEEAYEDENAFEDAGDFREEYSNPDNAKTEPVKEHEAKWYESIDGLDPDIALKNSGSEENLRMVLEIFHESIDVRSAELEGFYDKEDWENYTIKVHALKSSARLVGASALGDMSEKLEMAGKEGDITYIRSNHLDMISELKKYKESLDRIFGATDDTGEKEEKQKPDEDEDFDRVLIESVYDAIKEGASSGDDQMIKDTLSEIADYEVPAPDKEKLDKIKECFDKSDYNGIISIIGGAKS